MDRPTDTLLGNLRDAVYHRYKVDRIQRLPPAEGAELRATRFAAWLAESQGASLDAELVRHWAVVDLMAHQEAGLPPVDEPSQRRVLEAMRGNAQRQSSYALTLRTLMPDLDLRDTLSASSPDEAQAIPAASPQVRDAEERKRAESEFLLVEIERRPDPIGASDAPVVVETARADAEAVRRISTIDERELALVVMGWRAYEHDGYREALHNIAPDVASVAVALRSRVEDAAYKLPRDQAEDAVLDAAVRGLDTTVAPSISGAAASNDIRTHETAKASSVATDAGAADSPRSDEQMHAPVERASAPSPSAESNHSEVASTAESSAPAPMAAADRHDVRLSKEAKAAPADIELAQEKAHLATIRDRHAAVIAAGKTIGTLVEDEVGLLAQADAEALRQIRNPDHLVEIAAELGESLENPHYCAALAKADFQVAKAMDTLHLERKLQAEREKARASRPRGMQGVLVELGEAPYQFKDSQPKTFYAKYIEDNSREGIVWGRHLPAALRASEAEIGDRIWFVRKPTPPELLDNSEGLLPCDLTEFAVEVREKAQLLPEDVPTVPTSAPGQGPTYRFRITDPVASRASPSGADAVLSENVAGLAAALELRRGRSVHVEDFRLGKIWQLEVDSSGTVRSTAGSAFNIADLSDADEAPAIKQEEPTPPQPGSSTEQEIDKRLLQRVATVRQQDVVKARRTVGLSTPQGTSLEASLSFSLATPVDASNATELPPAPSSQRSQGLPAKNAPGGEQASAKAETPTTAPPLKVAHPLPPADTSANGFTGDPADRPTPSETICKLLESITYEMQRNGSVLYLVRERPAFIDHGQQILMHKAANDDDEAVLAAVLLAKEKWGGKIELTGTEEFKRRAIAIMLKHDVDVQLKNPQQEALRRDLMQTTPQADVVQDDSKPKPMLGKPATQRANDKRPDAAPAKSTSPVSTATTIATAPATAEAVQPPAIATTPKAAELAPIHARDWWAVQRDAIHYWSRNTKERDADMKRLGPEPAQTHMFWFDKAGRRCDPPADAEAFVTRVAADKANSKELNMATKQSTPQEAPQVVLRGVKKVGDKFETTALLFKGKGDFLQGFITVGGQKRQVIVHMHERKPDSETGELRPNFLRISEAQGDAKNPRWKEIGYGNAVNHRADGKPVYFDEVLFNVANEVVKARATGPVDSELHRRLGFVEARKSRAAANDSSDRPGEAALPKAAPVAEMREAVAGAAAPTKSRHSSRSRVAA